MQKNVLNYLDTIVEQVPDKVAYSDETDALTFREVWQYSRAIGSFLHQEGVYKKPVVVFMRRSPAEIAAFFGVVTGGCYYVPVDEEMPSTRIRLILENVRPPLILCDDGTLPLAEKFLNRQENADCRLVLCRDLLQTPVDEKALEAIRDRAIDTDPVYIVFTSGSTGIPKGVAACHRSVMDYIDQLSEVLHLGRETVFGSQTPLYFDACLKEIYPTVKFGATTWLIPKRLFSTPVALVEYLNAHRINTICWVVSALTMVSAFRTFDTVKPEYLHTVAFGSEVLLPKQLRIWQEAVPDATFTNLYGPTEGTGMCCYYRVDRTFSDGEVIPIGRPFHNREILLLGDDGAAVPAGQEGEICIRGTSVTLGYYNDPERTAAAYVQNPLNHAYPELIYRTGDIGRLGEDGLLYFVSRRDCQVKHMGHRIELGEVETDAASVDGVSAAACVFDEKRKKLVLYYTGTLTEAELMMALKERLPRYMCPGRLVRMDALPRTPNGKTDRRALQALCAGKVR